MDLAIIVLREINHIHKDKYMILLTQDTYHRHSHRDKK